MTAPSEPGKYEVRLHTDYPAKATNLRYAVAFTVDTHAIAADETPRSQQRFTIATATPRAGGKLDVAFATPLVPAAGERFWITIVATGAPDTEYGAWQYVPDGARAITLDVPDKAGEYEIRLHANYPRLSTNVVHRAAIHVQ
jgi:hypothetical protein